MVLTDEIVKILQEASARMLRSDFVPYLDLKILISRSEDHYLRNFQSIYRRFYGLRMSEAGQTRYFEILLQGFRQDANQRPTLEQVLQELAQLDQDRVHLSFASKLLGMWDESSPLYDRHVSRFFGKQAPGADANLRERAEWLTHFLTDVRNTYKAWSIDERVVQILADLVQRYPELADCNTIRLMDFLVWKAGKENLY